MNTLSKTQILSGIFTLCTCFAFSQDMKYANEKYTIVLDVQQYWTDNSLPDSAAAEMLRSINTVIEKTNPDKVIYIKSSGNSAVLSISFKGIKKETITAGEFDKNLKIVNNTVFEKTEGDAFTVKAMTDIFEQNNAKEIIITGLLAEECVSNTAFGGISRNYTVYLIPEAVGAKTEKSKEKAIKKLRKAGVQVIKLSEL